MQHGPTSFSGATPALAAIDTAVVTVAWAICAESKIHCCSILLLPQVVSQKTGKKLKKSLRVWDEQGLEVGVRDPDLCHVSVDLVLQTIASDACRAMFARDPEE